MELVDKDPIVLNRLSQSSKLNHRVVGVSIDHVLVNLVFAYFFGRTESRNPNHLQEPMQLSSWF